MTITFRGSPKQKPTPLRLTNAPGNGRGSVVLFEFKFDYRKPENDKVRVIPENGSGRIVKGPAINRDSYCTKFEIGWRR